MITPPPGLQRRLTLLGVVAAATSGLFLCRAAADSSPEAGSGDPAWDAMRATDQVPAWFRDADAGKKPYPITDQGAVGDGVTMNTRAIQATIDRCAAQGGGIVVVPKGVFMSGSIFIRQGVSLRVEKDGVLKGSDKLLDYLPAGATEDQRGVAPFAFVNVDGVTGTVLSGEGTIDGNGSRWWTEYWKLREAHVPDLAFKTRRPKLVHFTSCNKIGIVDLTLQNQAEWCVDFQICNDVVAENLTIRAGHNAPSSDGIDPDSCQRVLITGCSIEVDDDCISIKAARRETIPNPLPCQYVIVQKTHFHYGQGGVAIGSETSGGIRHVLVRDCTADDENWAPVRFKSAPSRGGVVEDITYQNFRLTGVRQAFEFRMDWSAETGRAGIPGASLPVFRDIHLIDVTGTANSAGLIRGLEGSPVTGVTFTRCRITAGRDLAILRAKDIDLSGLVVSPPAADGDYVPGPDSGPEPAVPTGELLKFTFDHSKFYPGTTRSYWIYVPVQYKADTPACLFVGQDGVQWRANEVFDNLIARKQMPVTIGVFVEPGVVRAASPGAALDRYNRSFEYDSLGDTYVRFLLEELLPDVATKEASDGRPIRISSDPNDRAIGGQSSGAIAAFTAAWERPDSFRRVFSAIGTYVGLRGGDVYPTLIRKYEPKPIRVFLQDGANDQNKYGGDWWFANQMMERALVFAGYEVNHVWGVGSHSSKQATVIFPDAMRWLWKDWPQPVKAGTSGNEYLNQILIPGEGWQVVKDGMKGADGVAVNAKGEVFFCDTGNEKTYKIGLDGAITPVLAESHHVTGQAFGPDGRLYADVGNTQAIVAYADGGYGPATVLAQGFRGNDLVVAHTGNVYVTNPPDRGSNLPSKVWLIRTDGTRLPVDTGIRFCNGITLSPDQSLLYVDDSFSHWVYSFVIQPDGTLADKQKYGHLHDPDYADYSGADGMHADRDGRIYASSTLGIQVCDQIGRVECIIPTPNRHVVSVCLGGANFDTLYAGCGSTLYRRKVRVSGANGWDIPNKPPVPKL
jgi:sugar lactone lactonase YvrE